MYSRFSCNPEYDFAQFLCILFFKGFSAHWSGKSCDIAYRACTCLRLKPGWTSGSGHGPQWGTWAPMSGRRNEKASRADIFIVGSSLFPLQKRKIDSRCEEGKGGHFKRKVGLDDWRGFGKENNPTGNIFPNKLKMTSDCAHLKQKHWHTSQAWTFR